MITPTGLKYIMSGKLEKLIQAGTNFTFEMLINGRVVDKRRYKFKKIGDGLWRAEQDDWKHEVKRPSTRPARMRCKYRKDILGEADVGLARELFKGDVITNQHYSIRLEAR